MTPKEAIEAIQLAQAEVEWEYPMDYHIAFSEAIKALEKQIPAKPTILNNVMLKYRAARCPNCETILADKSSYCRMCGQSLKWEE